MPPQKPQEQGQQTTRSAADQLNQLREQQRAREAETQEAQAREAEPQTAEDQEQEAAPPGGTRALTARALIDEINGEFERVVTANDPDGNGAVLAAMYRAVAPKAGPVIQDVLLRRLGIAEE